MKDIDFDELDRAVSSVLGQKAPSAAVESATTPVADTDQKPSGGTFTTNTTFSAEETAKPSPTPTEAEPDRVNVSSRPELNLGATARTQNPFATKPRGKFMDVMHPSADMSSTFQSSSESKMTHTTIEPLTPLLTEHIDTTAEPEEKDEESSLEPIVDVDESKTLIGAEPVAVDTASSTPSDPLSYAPASSNDAAVDKPLTSSGYVDPLAAFDASDTALDKNEDVEEEADVPGSISQNDPSPQPSPFLSDTKVDKRPLGGFGDVESSVAGSDKPVDATNDEVVASGETQPPVSAVTLPRELQPDVVEVESVQEKEVSQDSVAKSSSSPFATSIAPAAAVDDDRVEGHPLFDTSTYHEPIAAVHAKKTPAWVWWLVGLVICLIVGAGVGYFLFTAGL